LRRLKDRPGIAENHIFCSHLFPSRLRLRSGLRAAEAEVQVEVEVEVEAGVEAGPVERAEREELEAVAAPAGARRAEGREVVAARPREAEEVAGAAVEHRATAEILPFRIPTLSLE